MLILMGKRKNTPQRALKLESEKRRGTPKSYSRGFPRPFTTCESPVIGNIGQSQRTPVDFSLNKCEQVVTLTLTAVAVLGEF